MKKLFCVSLAICLCAFIFVGCNKNSSSTKGAVRPVVQSEELQFASVKDGDNVAVIHTSLGDVWVVLYPQYAPMAVENFTGLASSGYYNNNLVVRVEKDFLWQAGDATNVGNAGQSVWGNGPFPIEVTEQLHHYAGALCMSQNTKGEGNLSQFYIVSAPAGVDKELEKAMQEAGYSESVINAYKDAGGVPYLDYEYTVFGQVFEGMDIVDAINQVATDDKARPVDAIFIKGIEVGVWPFTPLVVEDDSAVA